MPYVTRALEWRWEGDMEPYPCYQDEGAVPDLTVYEDDGPVDTGLLDHRGDRIYRVSDRVRMGFHQS